MNSGEEYLDNLLKSMMEGNNTENTAGESKAQDTEILQAVADETAVSDEVVPDGLDALDDMVIDETDVSDDMLSDGLDALDDMVIDETDVSDDMLSDGLDALDDMVIDETDVSDDMRLDGLDAFDMVIDETDISDDVLTDRLDALDDMVIDETDVSDDVLPEDQQDQSEMNGADNGLADFDLSELGLDDLGLEKALLPESEASDFSEDDALENLLADSGEQSESTPDDMLSEELALEESTQNSNTEDGNMSEEEIERLLNGDIMLGDETQEAAETEIPTLDDSASTDDLPLTDDLALEDYGESDEDLSALLEGMEQNEDLSEINDLLEKSDQGVSVDDDMLAMLESVPESGESENSEESFDFFSGEEAVEGEPENIRELTAEEQEEREESKKGKKEKKKREKKPRRGRKKKGAAGEASAEGEDADALASLLEKTTDAEESSKKKGLFARLLSFLLEEDEEISIDNIGGDANTDELLLGGISEENKQVLDDLNKEDQENTKKKKKKEKKKKEKKSNKSAEENGESEEAEGEDKEKGKKKKLKKKKKEKNPEGEVPAVPEKKLSRKKVITVFLYCATMAACIIVISRVLPNYMQKRDARIAYDNQKYDEVFELLYGKNLSEEDELILEKSSTILQMRRKLDSYENYEKLNMPLEALDALISGVNLHQKLLPKADEYLVADEVNKIYDQILEKLSEYGISESDALDIIASGDNVTYSQRLESIIYGNSVTPENAEETIQDVLPEEEEIIDRLEQSEEAETEQE